jgi:CO/xanthine dehydrogenase Mo-binding subunit
VPYVGSRLKRPDDPRLLTGRGRYVDDIALPRMVHAVLVRSVHAHARVARLDLDAARRAPGVVAVLAGADVARLCTPYRGVLHQAAPLEAHEDDVQVAGGRVTVKGVPDRALSLGELARAAHFRSNELRGVEPSVEATVHYTNPTAWTFTNGAHLAMVEVDVETGGIRLLRYVAVDDCGRVVNPALVDGQVQGGVAQGIGGALSEHCV